MAVVIHLNIVRWGDDFGSSSGTNVITRVLIRERQEAREEEMLLAGFEDEGRGCEFRHGGREL